MDNELRYFLQQGPTSVKELARKTGKSTSTIYKALKDDPDVIKGVATNQAALFSLRPSAPEEASADPRLQFKGNKEDAERDALRTKLNAAEIEERSKAPESTAEASTPVSPPPAVASSSPTSKRGRKPTAEGKQLYPDASLLGSNDNGSTPTYQNPRRNGSAGKRSLQIIIDHPGITTEDYLAKGGRLNDLRWDLAHGSVRAE